MEQNTMICDTPTALRFFASAANKLEAELMRKAADEIERLRKREALWQWCAKRTAETYGGCYRPEYAEKVEAAAKELAGE